MNYDPEQRVTANFELCERNSESFIQESKQQQHETGWSPISRNGPTSRVDCCHYWEFLTKRERGGKLKTQKRQPQRLEILRTHLPNDCHSTFSSQKRFPETEVKRQETNLMKPPKKVKHLDKTRSRTRQPQRLKIPRNRLPNDC